MIELLFDFIDYNEIAIFDTISDAGHDFRKFILFKIEQIHYIMYPDVSNYKIYIYACILYFFKALMLDFAQLTWGDIGPFEDYVNIVANR